MSIFIPYDVNCNVLTDEQIVLEAARNAFAFTYKRMASFHSKLSLGWDVFKHPLRNEPCVFYTLNRAADVDRKDDDLIRFALSRARVGLEFVKVEIIRIRNYTRLKATPEKDRVYNKDGKLRAYLRDKDETANDFYNRVFYTYLDNPDGNFSIIPVRLPEDSEQHKDFWNAIYQLKQTGDPKCLDQAVSLYREIEYNKNEPKWVQAHYAANYLMDNHLPAIPIT